MPTSLAAKFERLVKAMNDLRAFSEETNGADVPLVLVLPTGELKQFTDAAVSYFNMVSMKPTERTYDSHIVEFNGAFVQEANMWPRGKVFIYQGHYLMAVFDVKEGESKNLWQDVGLQINTRSETFQ